MARRDAHQDDRIDVQVTFGNEQLRKKFKHAPAFGVDIGPSPEGLRAFEAAMRLHLSSSDAVVRRGTFRGMRRVVLFVGQTSGRLVMTSETGEFISAWQLGNAQLHNVLARSSL